MEIKFRLSNRQRKELFVRGRRLDIALPLPQDEDEIKEDLRIFAARLIADLDEGRVQAAEWETLLVNPLQTRATPPENLTQAIGAISTVSAPGNLYVRVETLVVTLAPPRTRHAATLPQWPGTVIVDGKAFFAADAAE